MKRSCWHHVQRELAKEKRSLQKIKIHLKKLTENQDPVSPIASRRNINESEYRGSQKRVTESPSNLNQDLESSYPKRQKPCCPNCGKNHFGECWRIVGNATVVAIKDIAIGIVRFVRMQVGLTQNFLLPDQGKRDIATERWYLWANLDYLRYEILRTKF